ncbi:MAG: small-conductance mechanosensitive channel-like protein [Aciduliprofundum sp.]|nr:MAG: small-conductance mechanosensitive channel-like protein [Aciduliprofundum sp.]
MENKQKVKGYASALAKFIGYIALFIIISAMLQFLIQFILPKYGISIESYYVYINVSLTIAFGYLIIKSFADLIYEILRAKYTEDVAKAFRNVFLLIGVGALITTIAGEVGGGLAGVSVGGFLGIVIGFATQQVMGQAVAGLFLLIARPMKINDLVTLLGDTGVVNDISILFTELIKEDGTRVLIPNNMILGNKIYVLPKKK